ncbi:hypothetical protein MW887_000069 [Aspergillus wentii]|nr:hypothetical protein MW887_000069 [Aspergillus wentii]
MKISNALTTIFSLLFISAKAHLDANPSPLQNAVIHTPSNRITAASEFNITFGIKGYSQNLTFVLEPNKDLISKDTHVQYLDTEGKISHSDLITPSMHRIFKGTVWTPSAWEKVGWARILMLRDGVDPLFEGAFTIASEQYQIRSQSTVTEDTGNAKEQVMVYRISKSNLEGRSDDKSSFPQSICRSGEHHSIEPSFALLERQFNQGDLTDTIGSTSGCPNRRRVAYVGIATDCSYTAAFDSTDAVRQNILSVVNTASVVFENSFNISLGLRNLTISDAACPGSASDSTPWNVACSTGDLNWRLNRFSSWRGSIDDDDNAYWTLMTECNTGGEVGVSWIGALCNYGSFGYTTSVGANVVARVENAEWQVFAIWFDITVLSSVFFHL